MVSHGRISLSPRYSLGELRKHQCSSNGFLSDGRQKFAPADPNFGIRIDRRSHRLSIYNSGSVGLRKEFGENFSVLANYVYGKSIDIATENQLQDEPQDYLAPQLDRAVGDNDVRTGWY